MANKHCAGFSVTHFSTFSWRGISWSEWADAWPSLWAKAERRPA